MKNCIRRIVETFVRNDYSEQTKKEVWKWFADEEHAEEKEQALHMLWEKAGMESAPANMNDSLKKMKQNIGFQTEIRRKKLLPSWIWQAAAVFFFAVSTVSITLMIYFSRIEDVDLIENYTPVADLRQVTLPDGTEVILNSKTTLLYPAQFKGDTRSVYLIGEADFKVKPDKEHPFIVKSNGFQVTALGTEFNVEAYADDDCLTATLLSGSVQVDFNNLQSQVILKPHEQLVFNRSTKEHQVHCPDMEDVTAWQRGELIFSEMSLEDIITRLEHKYPYTFVYSLHSLKKDRYTFRFPAKTTLPQVMDIITRVVGDMEYQIKENKCYLIQKKR